MVHLDYNLAYYKLTQARVNQLAQDQEQYLFVEFNYQNELLKNIYLDNDREGYIFKIQFISLIDGNIYRVKKSFYPEELYDYVTLVLDDQFLDFYYENIKNPKYENIDLRLVWYFLQNDKNSPVTIKWVRDSKYIFSYKKLCEYYTRPIKERADIRLTCKNLGLIYDPNSKHYYCPNHFNIK